MLIQAPMTTPKQMTLESQVSIGIADLVPQINWVTSNIDKRKLLVVATAHFPNPGQGSMSLSHQTLASQPDFTNLMQAVLVFHRDLTCRQ